ncbi:MAG: hypothetical protein U1F11_15660 [Steroidobacteraceae bacterium]
MPLILLTLEAWQFRNAPRRMVGTAASGFGQARAFPVPARREFLGFLGAGMFGFMINLPIVNFTTSTVPT